MALKNRFRSLSIEIEELYIRRARLQAYLLYCEKFNRVPSKFTWPGMKIQIFWYSRQLVLLRRQRRAIVLNEQKAFGFDSSFYDDEIGGLYLQKEQNRILKITLLKNELNQIEEKNTEILLEGKFSPNLVAEAKILAKLSAQQDAEWIERQAIQRVRKSRANEPKKVKSGRVIRRIIADLYIPFISYRLRG